MEDNPELEAAEQELKNESGEERRRERERRVAMRPPLSFSDKVIYLASVLLFLGGLSHLYAFVTLLLKVITGKPLSTFEGYVLLAAIPLAVTAFGLSLALHRLLELTRGRTGL